MAYTLYNINELESAVPLISKIIRKNDLFNFPLFICQNSYVKDFLKFKLSKESGCFGAVKFIDQNEILSFFLKELNLNTSNNFVLPDKLAFQISIFDILKNKKYESEALDKYIFKETKDGGENRILSLSNKLAILFDSYNKTRWKMVRSWEQGKPFFSSENYLSTYESWQMDLWKKIFRNSHFISNYYLSQQIRSLDKWKDIEKTIIIVGSAFLLETNFDLLFIMANKFNINHFLIMPTNNYFGDKFDQKIINDETLNLENNNLVNSWGKLGRGIQNKILNSENISEINLFSSIAKDSLLGKLKNHIFEFKNSHKNKEVVSLDNSIKVLSVPSKFREVEILGSIRISQRISYHFLSR